MHLLDREAARTYLREHVGGVVALPPGAESGLCGRCGAPVTPDAPAVPYVVPPTQVAFPIALCPAHAASEADDAP